MLQRSTTRHTQTNMLTNEILTMPEVPNFHVRFQDGWAFLDDNVLDMSDEYATESWMMYCMCDNI